MTGAKFANSVASATVVYVIDQCQNRISPANSTPARPIGSAASLVAGTARASKRIHSHSKGSASSSRWKPVATGPSSDRRTKIGENPIAIAPAKSAGSARRPGRFANEDMASRLGADCGAVVSGTILDLSGNPQLPQ